MKSSRAVVVGSCALVALGYLLPLWPLALLGVAAAALFGRWFLALLLGLMLDLAWGTPLGVARYLYLPFTFVALCGALARLWAQRYLVDRSLPERI